MLFVVAQSSFAQSTENMYVITLNGDPVTVDGDVSDWSDAQFIYMSQDNPMGIYIDQGDDAEFISGPDDFSGYVGIKMDNDNIYFGGIIRDELPLIYERPDSLYLTLFNTEHLGVYIGLYDIEDRPGSPHTESLPAIDPATGDTLQGGSTYRINPDYYPEGMALGSDYQMGVSLQPYGTTLENGAFYASGADAITSTFQFIGQPIADTEIAILLAEDGVTYTYEWKVPFASLSGQLITDEENVLSAATWPLYTPADGDVIPFDLDLTDDDRIGKELTSGDNDFLRYGSEGALWRDSFGMQGRGVVRDAAKITKANYLFGLFTPGGADITIDGDISDWAEAHFIGTNQDDPYGIYIDQGDEAEFISGPNDFSGYVSVQLDEDNIYFATKVRDELPLIYERPDSLYLTLFNTEHLGVYLGLYDIGSAFKTPHNTSLPAIDPATGDTLQGGSTYRIGPDYYPAGAALGADYQMGVSLQPYGTTLENGAFYASGADVITSTFQFIGQPVPDTEIAILLDEDGTTYTAEWKVPFASLSGQLITDPENVLSAATWPLYTPSNDDVIHIDFDLTDDDRIGKELTSGDNDFLRFGDQGALWRDSFATGWRLAVTTGADVRTVDIEEFGDVADLPSEFALRQNYPNPFNPITTIEFDVASAASTVSLKVYNVLGQEVATLFNGELNANRYQVQWDANGFASGMYIYRLEVNGKAESRKMLLLK